MLSDRFLCNGITFALVADDCINLSRCSNEPSRLLYLRSFASEYLGYFGKLFLEVHFPTEQTKKNLVLPLAKAYKTLVTNGKSQN